jgi:predicted nucleotide-binding protein (sugar kinase/HSP70/actin superfamily)
LLSDRTSDNTTNEMGDLLYLINRDIYDNFSKSNKYLTEFSDEFDRINNRRISHNLNVNGTNDYKDVLTTMHKFNMYCSNDDIINLLSLGFNNENFDFVKQVYTIQNPNIK